MDARFEDSNVSLDNNEGCIIDNPLKRKSLEKVLHEARLFADQAKADRKLFERAARIARDPPPRVKDSLPDWDFVPGITTQEKKALNDEISTNFWKQPKVLRVTVVTLCFSAIIQGWIQTGSNGSNQSWPTQFGLLDSNGDFKDHDAIWIFAGVNAITYLSASLFGCWLSDPLQSYAFGPGGRLAWLKGAVLGRRGAIMISGALCFASLVGAACSQTWQQLLACRFIVGLGMGSKASITPIFGAEISPSHLRGALVMNWQLFDAMGIFLGFTANLILFPIGPVSWRFQMASACVPTLCLLCLIWTVPESPRWLLKQSREEEAFRAMCALRATHLQAARELFYANAQLQIEAALLQNKITDVEAKQDGVVMEQIERVDTTASLTFFQTSSQQTSYWTRIWLLFQRPRTRRASIAAAVVMIGQQLCGINILAFYSSTFFQGHDNSSSSAIKALWLSFGFGLANFVFTFPAYYQIDTKGRRFLLLTTYPGMALMTLAACLSFLCDGKITRNILVGLFVFLFALFYSIGQGPVAFAYASEVFPLINRETGMSFSVFVNLLGAGLLTLFAPLAQAPKNLAQGSYDSKINQHIYDIGQARLLGCFVGFNVIAFLLIFFLVPETAGTIIPKEEGQLNYLRLEELNYTFGVPTAKHIKYQVKHVVPWALKMAKWYATSWITKEQRPMDPEPLYVWAVLADQESEADTIQEDPASGKPAENLRQPQALAFSPVMTMANSTSLPGVNEKIEDVVDRGSVR